VIETERLVLRRPRAEEGIAQWLERWESWGLSLFALERREDGRVLGRAGFLRWDPETRQVGGDEVELGRLLARGHWGRGYATEAGPALRDWALGERGLTRLVSPIDHANLRSVRVAERLGERYERDVDVRGRSLRLYSVER
jgi:RimJ/RimL family protein N-acetyltransferase